jgi:hypothetical protein
MNALDKALEDLCHEDMISPWEEAMRLSEEARIASHNAHASAKSSAHAGAASYHREAANQWGDVARISYGKEKSIASGKEDLHRRTASEHQRMAVHAGAEWDEDKHPRDESGKFS